MQIADGTKINAQSGVTKSLKTVGTEIVKFPLPIPLVVIETPVPPLLRISFEPAVPVVSEVVKVSLLSYTRDPIVMPLAPLSFVTVRFAVGALKIAVAPMAFGTTVVSQFTPAFQLPPAVSAQVSA